MIEDLTWPQGWLLSQSSGAGVPSWWTETRLGPWTLANDPRLPVASSVGARGWGALLGHALDPSAPRATTSEIIVSLLGAYGESRQMIIDRLIGRFVIAIADIDDESVVLQQDAAGLRAVYYEANGARSAAGSHADLVASTFEQDPEPSITVAMLLEDNLRTFPGCSTPFKDVRRLTPNLELDLVSGRLRRVFPRTNIVPMSTDDAVDLLIERVGQQAEAFQRTGQHLLLSLSAGLDSRVSLALLRGYEPLTAFTYDFPDRPKVKANRYDLETSLRLAEIAGINHEVLSITGTAPREFTAPLSKSWPLSHSKPLALGYFERFGDEDLLHVRSNVYETGARYYRLAGYADAPLDARQMIKVASSRRQGKGAYANREYTRYIQDSSFDSIQDFGYDPYDFFFLEMRIGSWMATALHESDAAFDSHVLIDSREILSALVSIPIRDQESAAIPRSVLSRRWPELLTEPVNGRLLEPRP